MGFLGQCQLNESSFNSIAPRAKVNGPLGGVVIGNRPYVNVFTQTVILINTIVYYSSLMKAFGSTFYSDFIL